MVLFKIKTKTLMGNLEIYGRVVWCGVGWGGEERERESERSVCMYAKA